ncbi:MAG: zinc-ribbon domain-containing protein [Proteobacteria bacterium]|nr:zinc-ribbon domain-containing protein [Pseudomonadota bacterium]
MEIICDKCQSKLKIPDGKIPAGKTANVTCPSCKQKIAVTGPPEEEENEEPAAPSFDFEEDEDKYDSSEKPFDFIEEEGKTALICESDAAIRETMSHVLDLLEYHITVASDTRDALKKMRYHDYNLILVNEHFETSNPETNGILIYLQRMAMSSRRNMIVGMLSNRFRTMDNMIAFVKSVNMIINTNDMENFDKILTLGIGEHEFFYRIFNESLKKTGKI